MLLPGLECRSGAWRAEDEVASCRDTLPLRFRSIAGMTKKLLVSNSFLLLLVRHLLLVAMHLLLLAMHFGS